MQLCAVYIVKEVTSFQGTQSINGRGTWKNMHSSSSYSIFLKFYKVLHRVDNQNNNYSRLLYFRHDKVTHDYWMLDTTKQRWGYFLWPVGPSLWLFSHGFELYIYIYILLFLCPLAWVCIVYVVKEVVSFPGAWSILISMTRNRTRTWALQTRKESCL